MPGGLRPTLSRSLSQGRQNPFTAGEGFLRLVSGTLYRFNDVPAEADAWLRLNSGGFWRMTNTPNGDARIVKPSTFYRILG